MNRTVMTIAGGTGSGKSTLTDALALHLDAAVLRIDDYYRPLDHLTFEERERVNFDAPEAIDHDLLVRHLIALRRGEAIDKPVYDFSRHTRRVYGETIEAKDTILVEGIFALYWPELNEIADVRVFVDTPADLRFSRRLFRDVHERGRDEDEVTHRFLDHVGPMHRVYVEPTRRMASVCVSGNQDLRVSVGAVLDAMKPVTLVGADVS
jgi:uridine kinase